MEAGYTDGLPEESSQERSEAFNMEADLFVDLGRDDCCNSTDYNADVEISGSEETQTQSKFSRRKRHQVDKKQWCSNVNKENREKGKEYRGTKKIKGKWLYNLPKAERTLKPRCECQRFFCNTVSDADRLLIFKTFWGKSWHEKTIFVSGLMEKLVQKRARHRKIENVSRRSCSYKYYLPKGRDKLQVCKKMFLNTLNIGEWTARNWKNKSHDQFQPKERIEIPRKLRQKNTVKTANVKLFLTSLPKIESHYCRAVSNKKYLESRWNSKQRLFQAYIQWCKERHLEYVSCATFAKCFEDENLSLFKPKKDECDTCVAFKQGNLDAESFRLHQELKEQARNEKARDKEIEDHVYTMDLQSVLLCPKTNVSSSYFKTKLVVHNFTIYNLKTAEGHSFLWNEMEGTVSANEFSTIISNFITNILPTSSKIILYSDGCTAQNRNCTLANALLNLAMIYGVTIEQKFLEKGHTQMEVDSMHSCIERALKFRNVNIPADYIQIIKDARKAPQPYTVEYLQYDYFKNFNTVNFYNSIRPGRKSGDPVVTNIRALRYQSDGNVMFKLSFTEHWQPLPARKSTTIKPTPLTNLPNLYSEQLKIKKSKYLHLQELKKSLPKDYHAFYDNIQFTS